MKDFFSAEAGDRRQNFRIAINHRSRLRLTLDSAAPGTDSIYSATLTDISQEGLRASEVGGLLPGDRVMLEVPLLGWREADVMWMAADRIGCRFLTPLSLDELRVAALSSERLADECPGFAAQIRDVAAVAAPSGPSAPKPASPPTLAAPVLMWPALSAIGGILCLAVLAASLFG